MKITDIEIRMCRHNDPVMKDSEMRDGKKSELEFLVITFHTDEGLSTSTFGFAGRGALGLHMGALGLPWGILMLHRAALGLHRGALGLHWGGLGLH